MSDTRPAEDRVGTVVTHRRYVPYSHAHYAGNLVDGAYSLGLFGDVATEMCILLDGDEGLFASYSDVQFKAPVRAGDVLDGLRRARGRARRSDRGRARCCGGPRTAGRGDHRHRHRRRTSHIALGVGVSRHDTPIQVKFSQ